MKQRLLFHPAVRMSDVREQKKGEDNTANGKEKAESRE
jgi:hypothetical protein